MVHDRKVNKIIRKGVTRNLSNMPDKGCKMRLFPGDIIEVHLYDGFPVVANRQPTLRLESMIGFKVRIIQDIAMRLPVCFTTGLNADFDGDEMNIHAPQSTGAKLEVAVMLRAANQILSPQRNAPVNGIVQDGLVGCYILTNIWEDTGKCTFVPVEDFYMCIDRSRIPRNRVDNLLRRARKWYPEYISPDYTLDLIAEIPGTLFLSILFPPDLKYEKVTDENEKYPIVKIEEGVILPDSGPVCKKVVGARAGSFLHEIAIRSPDMAIEFLTECQFMVDHWLYTHGFSIGISDLFLSGDADDTITQTLMETEAKIANILDRCPNGVPDDAAEQEINGLLNSTMNVGLRLSRQNMSKGDRNALNIMRKSGAKGNLTNLVQTTAFVGQQNVNGRRIQPMLTGRTRTLPYFEDYDNSSRARGFVGNGYRDGLDPIQMFFHAMGGRQGIIATAVGTAVTGYIQKRIGRKMEDNIIHEDCSVRINPSAKEEIIEDETDDQARDVVLKGGKIIQFLYGGDGFDSRKLCYAKGLTFPFFCNPASVAARMNNAYRQSTNTDYPERKLDTEEIELIVSYITVGFHNHIKKLPPPLKRATDNVRHALSKACKFVTIIEDCIPDFCEELRTIFEKSKCQVGDKVGLVASSSVSEPATQMMLDTFHLAGVGTSDRGGGVPRLDELIGATKSDKQKKTTGMLYLKNSEIDLITKEIIDLKKSGLNSAKLQKLREDRLRIATVLKKTYEEVKVSDLMRGSCIKYIKEYVNSEEFFSPVEKSLEEIADMVGCTEYKPEWWATSPLNSQNISTLGKHYQWWVVCLEFDVGKLYERRITLKDIGFIIETTHTELRCICSPDIMGRIDVFCDYTEPLETFMNASKDFFVASQDFTRPSYLTVNNAPYFLCRDVITSVIKMTRLAGMEGIKKAFVREDLEGGNVVIDVDLQPKSTVVSKKRYIAMLSDPNVDPSKTIVDDMHTIASVLGIEAARKMIIEEDTRIISFNGTYINPRHIQLLVDNMTYTGEITSVRRDGISRDVGPIAKVMFEQPVTNAITAAVGTEQDSMRSIASSIMMGTLSSGTGSVIVK
jgi:DNA-directed RNA polymerase beta' subunit